MTSATSVQQAADRAKAEHRAVHIVVNNAGGPMRRMDRQILWPDTDWMDDLNLKIIGALRVRQAFLPLIPSDGSGRIINISDRGRRRVERQPSASLILRTRTSAEVARRRVTRDC